MKKEIEDPKILKVIKIGVLSVFLLPLFFSKQFLFPFSAPKGLLFFLIIEILFILYLWLSLKYEKYRFKAGPVFKAISIFFVISLLASIFGVDFSRSFWGNYERMGGIIALIHLLLFYIIIKGTYLKEKDWSKLFKFSLVVSVVVGIIGILAKLGFNFLGLNPIDGSTFGNSSLWGVYSLFHCFFALMLFFSEAKSVKKEILYLFSFVILFTSIMLCQARAVCLSFLGGMALIIILSLIFASSNEKLKNIGKILLIFSFLLLIISVFSFFSSDGFLHQKFIDLSTNSRFTVWDIAISGFLERPVLGWGMENFDLVFAKYFNPYLPMSEYGGEVWFDKAHNIVFDTLINSGIIGLLSYLFIFIISFYLLFKIYKKDKSFLVPGFMGVLLVSYFVQNLTVFDTITSYMLFFAVLAFIEFKSDENNNPAMPINKPLFSLAVFIFLLFFLNFVFQPARGGLFFIKSLDSNFSFQQRTEIAETALNSSPMGELQNRYLFAQEVISLFSEGQKDEASQEFIKMLDLCVSELEKSIKENPMHFRSYLTLGRIYYIYSFYDDNYIEKAEEVLEKGMKVSSRNQSSYYELANVKLITGEEAEAVDILKKAVALNPDFYLSHQKLADAAREIGDQDLASKEEQIADELLKKSSK